MAAILTKSTVPLTNEMMQEPLLPSKAWSMIFLCSPQSKEESGIDVEYNAATVSVCSSLSNDGDFGTSDILPSHFITERGWKLLRAFDTQNEGDPVATMIRQQEIECKERNHTTVLSCLVLIGVSLVFVWVYFFGLTDDSAEYGSNTP